MKTLITLGALALIGFTTPSFGDEKTTETTAQNPDGTAKTHKKTKKDSAGNESSKTDSTMQNSDGTTTEKTTKKTKTKKKNGATDTNTENTTETK